MKKRVKSEDEGLLTVGAGISSIDGVSGVNG